MTGLFRNVYGLYCVLMVAVMFVLSTPAMATNFIGSGQVCQTFTVTGPGKTVSCFTVAPSNQFLSEDSCRKHFEGYLTKTDAEEFVASTSGPQTLQPDANKILLQQGTTLSTFTDFSGYVIYNCTLNKNETPPAVAQ